jgi:tetratricopeptide (TPR) repeat protein
MDSNPVKQKARRRKATASTAERAPSAASTLDEIASSTMERYSRSLSIKEHVLGRNHIEVGKLLVQMGELAVEQRLHARSLAYFSRAKPILLAEYGQMGCMHRELAELVDSALCFEGAVRAYKAALGVGHKEVATPLSELGHLRCTQSRPAEAAALFHEALRILESSLGEGSVEVAVALVNLARARTLQGRSPEAVDLSRRALLIYEARFGEMHADVAHTLGHLGRALAKAGLLDEAEQAHQRALAIKEAVFGPEHEQTRETRQHLDHLRALADARFDEPWALSLTPAPEVASALSTAQPPTVTGSLAGRVAAQRQARSAARGARRKRVKQPGGTHDVMSASMSITQACQELERADNLAREELLAKFWSIDEKG